MRIISNGGNQVTVVVDGLGEIKLPAKELLADIVTEKTLHDKVMKLLNSKEVKKEEKKEEPKKEETVEYSPAAIKIEEVMPEPIVEENLESEEELKIAPEEGAPKQRGRKKKSEEVTEG